MQRLARMSNLTLVRKVWGTQTKIIAAREIYPTDPIGPYGHAGVHIYQQTQQTIPKSVYDAFVNGSLQNLVETIYAAIPNGPTMMYIEFAWNVVESSDAGVVIRDLAMGFVMGVHESFTGQAIIDAARSVSWFKNVYDIADMGVVNVWILTISENGGIPLEWVIVGGLVIAIIVVVAVT
jgi:hypothetical protein